MKKIIITILVINFVSIPAFAKKTESFKKIPANRYKKQQIVRVKNIREFIKSISPDKKIILKSNTYNLLKAKNIKNKYIGWNKDDLVIKNVNNLQIEGQKKVKILTSNYFAYVMNFENCNNLQLKNITIGHSVKSDCLGGVLRFTSSKNIKIDQSVLYGSGTIGITLKNIKNFHCINSTIKECSSGLLRISGSENCQFEKSMFKDTRGYELIEIKKSKHIKLTDCIFKNNCAIEKWRKNYSSRSDADFFYVDTSSSGILIKNSTFHNNYAHAFIKQKNNLIIDNYPFSKPKNFSIPQRSIYHLKFTGNKFDKNIFLEEINPANANNILFRSITKDLASGIIFALKNGANINGKDQQGKTPLILAISQKKQSIAKLIIEKGADINATDPKGCTPLINAVKTDNYHLAAKLIDNGANVLAKDQSNKTVFDHLLQNKLNHSADRELWAIFEKYPDILKEGEYLNRLIILAAENGQMVFINHFIKKGLNINKRYQNGNTLLHIAARSGNHNNNIIYDLLSKGAKTNIRNNDNKKPFDIATKSAKQVLYQKTPLKEKELILTIKNIAYQLKYEKEKVKESREKINNLLLKGADVNFTDPWGWTPLYTAADIGSLEIMKLLIKNGADINQKSHSKLYVEGSILYHYPKGVTPLDIALIKNYRTIINYFIKRKPVKFKKGDKIVISNTARFYDQKRKKYYYLPYGTRCIVLKSLNRKINVRLQKNRKITGLLDKSDISKYPFKKSYQDRLIIKTVKQKFYKPYSVAESFILQSDFYPDGGYPGSREEMNTYNLYLRSGLERWLYWDRNVPIKIKHYYQWLLGLGKVPAEILNINKYSKITVKDYRNQQYEYYRVKANKDNDFHCSWNSRLKSLPAGKSSFFKKVPFSFHICIGIIRNKKLLLYSPRDSFTRLNAYCRFNFIYLLQTYFNKENNFRYKRKNKKLYYSSNTLINLLVTDPDGSNVRLIKGRPELEIHKINNTAINPVKKSFPEEKRFLVYLAPDNITRKLSRYKNFKLTPKNRSVLYDFDNDGKTDFIECIYSPPEEDLATDRINLFNIKGKWIQLLRYRTHDVP